MKKQIKLFITITTLLSFGPLAWANTDNNKLIKVETYKEQLQAAFTLYQAGHYEKALIAIETMAKKGEKKHNTYLV